MRPRACARIRRFYERTRQQRRKYGESDAAKHALSMPEAARRVACISHQRGYRVPLLQVLRA